MAVSETYTHGAVGRKIMVAVDHRPASEAAFDRALSELQPGTTLLVVFFRPVRDGSAHYNFVMRSVLKTFDARAANVLAKYSTKAADAQVPFEFEELEGHHVRSALASKCQVAAASLLVVPTQPPTHKTDFCPECNPHLRSSGRLGSPRTCSSATCRSVNKGAEFPCPVAVVGRTPQRSTSGRSFSGRSRRWPWSRLGKGRGGGEAVSFSVPLLA